MSLSLKVRGPGLPSPASLVVSSSMTWQEFLTLVAKELKLKNEFELLWGFPAAVADYADDLVIGDIIQSNEVIRVQLKSASGQQAEGKGALKAKKKSSKTAGTAQAASAPTFGAKVAGIKHTPNRTSYLASSPAKRSASSSGMTTSAQSTKRRRKANSSNKISSENDIAEHLVSAVSGGTGTQNRAARKVFRNAVLHQYNSTQAVSRVNATYSGKYTIRECGGIVLSSAAASSSSKPTHTHIEVTYHKGAGSRGYHVDTVELLGKELLVGVLKVAVEKDPEGVAASDTGDGSDDREALKPMNLARCSPRIFWSIVYHYGADVADGIRTALRGIDDCTWLDERKRELSEKARENLQQQRELEARKRPRRGAAKVAQDADVKEEGKDSEVAFSPASNKAAGGHAASAPTRPEDPVQRWLVELIEGELSLSDMVPEEWQPAVEGYLGARNTGEGPSALQLACCRVSSRLCDTLESHRAELHKDTGGSVVSARLSLEQLEAWVTGARIACFHAVWRLLCGGGSERLRRALHRFRVRRPRDFRLWRAVPEGLLRGLLDQDAELTAVRCTWPSDAPLQRSSAGLDAERLRWMCEVAGAAAAVFAWMDADGLSEMAHSDAGESDETDGTGPGSNADQDADMPWQHAAAANEHMHRRVRVEVDNRYWEDGRVVAYLPPEPDEPMALWRVQLDAGAGDKADRFEDLEEHELMEAVDRIATEG